jgi:hypothetical protein
MLIDAGLQMQQLSQRTLAAMRCIGCITALPLLAPLADSALLLPLAES